MMLILYGGHGSRQIAEARKLKIPATANHQEPGRARPSNDMISILTNRISVTSYEHMPLNSSPAARNVTSTRNVISRINDNGRIVIPVQIRQQMGLKPGDALLLRVEGGALIAEPQQVRVRRVQDSLRQLTAPERRLSDDLMADRRQETQSEVEDWLG
jgi:AbrB family looped-hinge helix DNA binding protein